MVGAAICTAIKWQIGKITTRVTDISIAELTTDVQFTVDNKGQITALSCTFNGLGATIQPQLSDHALHCVVPYPPARDTPVQTRCL